MKKELFKLLVAEFQKLGINPTQWLGTRTNVKRINKKNMAESIMNEFAVNNEIEQHGLERIKKLFSEEAKYLGQLNDKQAGTLYQNLKTLNKIVNPEAPPEAQIYNFSKLPGDPITPGEYTSKSVADQEKIQTAILDAGMKVSAVDRTLANRLNLDMSKVSDWEKLQVWKDKHGIPDWAKDTKEGLGSLFKVVEDNPLADIGTQLDLIEKEGKSLVDQAKKLADKAWEMSPEGQAYRDMIRKDINRRGSEGKGFAGGVFGDRSDGYFRALVRPFLLAQHDKGKIKLAENTYNSLKNMDDLKGGNDFMSADPVRVFRQHYGDDAFDLIPDLDKFGMGPSGYGPTTDTRVKVLEEVIGKPILQKGPDNPGGYLTKGEYQAKLDHQDEVLGYIQRREGRFGDMTDKQLAEEVNEVLQTKATLEKALEIDYPPSDLEKLAFDPATKTTIGKNITKGFKKDKASADDWEGEAWDAGRDATDSLTGEKEIIKRTEARKKRDPFGIRLMKNFDQDLDDITLAKEGYNLQEIDILQRARKVMKDPEKDVRHPTEALRWVRGDMADEAGVDIDEFMTDFNWDDKYAQGGGVGSMFRRV